MPEVAVYNKEAKEVGKVSLNESIFAIKPNVYAMHMLTKWHLANLHLGLQSTLTRTEVRGGGRKPWRQKGTGHARQGSTRAPQWRHGGVALGPKPRSFSFAINKKLRRLALKSALSSKVAESEIIVIDDFETDEVKTKAIKATLKNLGAEKSTLIVLDSNDKNVILSSRNLPGVSTIAANCLNVYEILKHEKLLVTKNALSVIEEVYA